MRFTSADFFYPPQVYGWRYNGHSGRLYRSPPKCDRLGVDSRAPQGFVYRTERYDGRQLTWHTPLGYKALIAYRHPVKLTFAIRAVFAISLLLLLPGKMAFAHAGHDLGAMTGSTASQTQSFQSSSAQIAVEDLAAKITRLALLPVSDAPIFDATVVVRAADSAPPPTGCGPGCCCCGSGPSNCGMAGGCAASALFPAASLLPAPASVTRLSAAAADLLLGRVVAGPERPPNS